MLPLERWRLILGREADPEEDLPLDGASVGMDQVLEALYNTDRTGGMSGSSPKINRWLGDIRKYFPTPVVQLMQRDALERLGLEQILLEPELLALVEPDVHLAAAILSLNKVLPDKTRESARVVVRGIVERIRLRFSQKLISTLRDAINRSARNRRPRLNEVDWRRTIFRNLKHYQPEIKAIIPEQIYGFGRKGQALRHVILLIDQSGSMADSVVYAGIYASVLASMRSLRTDVIGFDTAVVDLSAHVHDPVELLFGIQLGGGTDINKALRYARQLVRSPRDTTLVLISDLYEGGNQREMLQAFAELQHAGVHILSLLALSDEGAPSYDHENAAALAQMGIKAMAVTPEQFPEVLSKEW